MDVKATPQLRSFRFTADDGTALAADVVPGEANRAILLLHGFWRGRRHPAIAAIRDGLAATGSIVVVPDLRGHGDSGGRFTFNYLESGDIEPLRRAARVESFHSIVALSMGGAIAVSAIGRGLVSTRELLLISPVARYGDLCPDLLEMVRGRHVEREQRHWTPRVDPRQLLTSAPRLDADEVAHRVQCPTLLVHAVDDWLVHHRHSTTLAARIPGSRLELLDLDSARRSHADRLVRQAWPIFGPLIAGIGAGAGVSGALRFQSSRSTI